MKPEELREIKSVVKEGVKESFDDHCFLCPKERAIIKDTAKIGLHIRGWILYSIAASIAVPAWIMCIYMVLRFAKVL